MKKLYFRVKTGYGAMDFISVDETELATAVRSQVTGKIGVFKEGTISGNHIISITPDWNRELGYNADYKLTGEDLSSVHSTRRNEHLLALQNTNARVVAQINGQPVPEKIENPVRIHTQGLTSLADLIDEN
jgi:sulfur carrier protein ThiS